MGLGEEAKERGLVKARYALGLELSPRTILPFEPSLLFNSYPVVKMVTLLRKSSPLEALLLFVNADAITPSPLRPPNAGNSRGMNNAMMWDVYMSSVLPGCKNFAPAHSTLLHCESSASLTNCVHCT